MEEGGHKSDDGGQHNQYNGQAWILALARVNASGD
jgi:hypothetical protein